LADLIIVALNRLLVALQRFAEPVDSCENLGLMLRDKLDGAFDFFGRHALLPYPFSAPSGAPFRLTPTKTVLPLSRRGCPLPGGEGVPRRRFHQPSRDG
jgi:hypothetical protein